MFRYLIASTVLCLSIFSSCAQTDLKEYEGNWKGALPNLHAFNFDIRLEVLGNNKYSLSLNNQITTIHKTFTANNDDRIQLSLAPNTHFDLALHQDGSKVTGFVKSGILMYHIELLKAKGNAFKGSWKAFMVDQLNSPAIFLSFENYDDGSFAAYPFFGDQRFTGTWCTGFIQKEETLLFRDFKTGLNFKARLLEGEIKLTILLANNIIATTTLKPLKDDIQFEAVSTSLSPGNKQPTKLDDGWTTASLQELEIKATPLKQMIDSVHAKSLVNTHSVLIAKQGKLVFEAYFEGYHHNLSHDQRSASKSIASAMTGIAIEDRLIESAEQSIYTLLPEVYQNTKNEKKAKIKIKDLLSMSSGIDAIDFGINRRSAASEGSYQSSDNWLKTVLDASMIYEPGTHANYGSANPFLLGVCLNEQLEQPLEWYMDQKLLSPLGISNYIIQTDNTGTTPYFGGGMYLTPRDMLKFGQLYLNKGSWAGKQLISEQWVEASFQQYLQLENTNEKNEYGYLWWHKTYWVNNKEVKSIEARGAGGQYIFVIPSLQSVIVITSGNFRNGKFQQPEKIVENYILPAILK
ncbi:MAG: beta-lactamase family protein [Saprospiraceae bacterium]|nr:beta-lactamase family protein [Saprospiraceae bacterium]